MSIDELGRLFLDLDEKLELARELEEAADVSAFVTVATRHGYEVTEEELRTSLRPEKEGELSDDQLERVAGGIIINNNRTARRFPTLRRLLGRRGSGLGAVSQKV